jgi:hypothetical protein
MLRPVTPLLGERTGLLVIRAWIEADGEPRLRARITHTVDIGRREEASTVAATPEEITRAVADWLDGFLRAANGDGALTEP